ncbi:MAG: cell division protein FtsQ/DivIB [Paracoccaceae bacterium]|nr:cell division protein FtsQ/DivIB [Paracoccaceae bacterium]
MQSLKAKRSTKNNANDPAPSRISYRLQRLWLTPFFRSLLRTGVPAFSVALFVAWYVSDQDNVDKILVKFSEVRTSIEERPEFMVSMMELKGASDEVAEDIREILPVDFPVSSFHLDMALVKETVEGLDAVKNASVRLRSGGIFELVVKERIPAAVWQSHDGFIAIDETGRRVSDLAAREARMDLPILAGEGADKHVMEGLLLTMISQELGHRVVGLVRVGERRWDVVLTNGQRILLPEEQADQVLERVIALDQAQDLLNRDISVVDMRQSNRPTVRMSKTALDNLRQIRMIEFEGINQ